MSFFDLFKKENMDHFSPFNILWFFVFLTVYIPLNLLDGEMHVFGLIIFLVPSAIISYGLTRVFLGDLPLSLIYLVIFVVFLFYAILLH